MNVEAYLALISTLVISCAWGAVKWSRRAAWRLDERAPEVKHQKFS